MLIDAVLLFGFMTMVFEAIVLSMLSPWARLRVLGSPGLSACVHFAMLGLNLAIHWGTVIGTFSAIFAFCGSILTIKLLRLIYGSIHNRTYRRGLVTYDWRALR